MIMKDPRRISPGLRRALAVAAVAATLVAGVKVNSDYTTPGSGFSTIATGAADPTGPTGGPGGDGGMNGGQFVPPSMPGQLPDYQGGNQPPLNQDGSASIYNTGTQGAPQQAPGQQGGQQPQQGWDQPAHGSQPPNYSTAPGYTQGPGQSNPDYQQPQQGNQSQPQQGTQNQQPSQAPSQTQQPDQNDQQDQQRQQQCEQQAEDYGILQEFVSLIKSGVGGAGSVFKKPDRGWQPAFECSCAPNQKMPQSKEGICDWPVIGSLACKTVTGTAQPDPKQMTPTQTPTPTETPTPTKTEEKCQQSGPDGTVQLPSLAELSKGSEKGLMPGAVNIARSVAKEFPDVKEIGGWRPPDRDANGEVQFTEHYDGHATDIMTDILGESTTTGQALGDKIVAYLAENSACFHIQWIIWNQQIWEPGQGWTPMPNRGGVTANHMDHVHVNSLVPGEPEHRPLQPEYKP